MEKFSFEKASKFKSCDKFFDINFLWLPGFRWVVEKLYYTSISPETIVILSLLSGIFASLFYSYDNYHLNLTAIIFIQLKNYLDSVDGCIARAKNLTSRFGRFLDSLSDALVYICLFTAIGINLDRKDNMSNAFTISFIAMICAFLQCSIYNYYLVSYKSLLTGKGINRTNEQFNEEERNLYKEGIKGLLLFTLQLIYQFIYGWQDKIISRIDSFAIGRFKLINNHPGGKKLKEEWYGNKKFLSYVSPLCFGTQIFILSLFTLADNLSGFLWFIIIAGNFYAVLIFIFRILLIK